MVRRLRAGFVLFHVAAVALANLPGPSHFRPALVDTPTGREQIAAWSRVARAVGVSLSDERARELVLGAAPALVQARRWLLAPFAPYHQLLGTRQPWRLFSFVDRDASAVHVDVLEDGVFRPLFRPLSPRDAWLAPTFEHERVRSILGSATGAPGHHAFPPFASWVAGRAFHDFPRASAVRVEIWRSPIPAPAARARGEVGPASREQTFLFERP